MDRKLLLIALPVLAAMYYAWPVIAAGIAPDLTWEVQLPDTDCSGKVRAIGGNAGGEGTASGQIIQTRRGFIYAIVACSSTTTDPTHQANVNPIGADVFVLRPDGAIVDRDLFDCFLPASPTPSAFVGGIAETPDGYIAVDIICNNGDAHPTDGTYCSVPTKKITLANVLTQADGSMAGFTNPISCRNILSVGPGGWGGHPHSIDTFIRTSNSVGYVTGGANARFGFECPARPHQVANPSGDPTFTPCSLLYQSAATPAHLSLLNGQPEINSTYVFRDSTQAGILNRATGSLSSTVTLNATSRGHMWTENGGGSVWQAVIETNQLRLIQRSSTTLAVQLNTLPAESTIDGHPFNSEANLRDYYLDGNGDMVACGTVDTNQNAWIAKFDTDPAQQVWNQTVNKQGGSIQEAIVSCITGVDGSVIALYGSFQTGNPGATTVFIRYYASGGTPREPEDTSSLVIPGPTSPTTAITAPAPLTAIINFVTDSWGFDTSILFGILITSIFTIGFARVGRSPMLIATGIFLGMVVSFLFGLFPIWIIFVATFIIIAAAGVRLFSIKGEDD